MISRNARSSFLHAAAAVAAAVALTGCYHSTQMAATWTDPSVRSLRFQHPITVFVTTSETMRRSVEDRMASKFPNATPSYRVLTTIDSTNGAQVRQQLAGMGFDGAIIMRVVAVTDQLAYVPGSYWYGGPYYSFAGYWGTAWGYPYDPGYVTQNQIVSMETQIYALATDKLVYAARSETTNPSSVNKLIDSVLRHVMEELQKGNLIASSLRCTAPTQCGSLPVTTR
ncbi:MAG TPA: hypothetical protein VI259_12900 [Gemmatimonadaceae bacterium]